MWTQNKCQSSVKIKIINDLKLTQSPKLIENMFLFPCPS